MRIAALSTAIVLTLVAATGTSRHRSVAPPSHITQLDPRRSMIITDLTLLQGFTFQRVLDQLIARSGVPNLTSAQLFRQWFDTQNPKPGLADPLGPHCDDFMTDGSPSFNGLPRRCPTLEGPLAATPFTSGEYFPIALVNRFDQAPADGSNCGQFRLVFARTMPFTQRLHIIMEPVLRNPNPAFGLAGCRAVAEFWAGLTKVDSAADRRAKLESFYFDGIVGMPPVIDPDNFSAASGGGIRTTQQGSDHQPRMYQFRLTKDCTTTPCTLRMTPDVLQNMPIARFFDSTSPSPAAQAFQDVLVAQVPNLAVRDVNEYFMEIPRAFLLAESNPTDSVPAFAYRTPFDASKVASPGFRNRIQQQLTAIGSTLTPEQIVDRADSLNCVGCHVAFGVGQGVFLPPSVDGIQQITEDNPEAGELGQRYRISPLVRDVFIPHRMKILMDFLSSGKAPVRSQ
jgi:hypothetical protein